MAKLATLLGQIDSGTLLLPEFQRGYVWNRDQVRGLMRSLYRGYPVGALLVWETVTDSAAVRGDIEAGAGVRLLLLDGQQRITSLYGIVRGKAPAFFDGDASAFTGLRFNVETETFEFYAPAKMRDDPRWVDISAMFIDGPARVYADLSTYPDFASYVDRIARLHGVLNQEFHEEKITGPDKTVDVVVDIFNRVNSGGTKLSKGDLALAKICAQWPNARGTLRGYLDHWKAANYTFTLDWLLRNATAVATGRSQFAALDTVDADDFERALMSSVKYIGRFLDLVAGRLGLDHDRVLMSRYSFPVVSRLLHLRGGHFADTAESERMLFWYIHSALWGRFAGSTETVLAQDYETVERSGVDGLIASLERSRGGNLRIDGQDFEGFGRGSRFYPLLYLLTRVGGARDFCSGIELRKGMLGHLAGLQVHHIFPKAALYEAGYSRSQVNSVANFCFLTQDCNLAIGRRAPEDYFAEAEKRHPGVLASQWIPQDPALWRMDRYLDFLAARRDLLANAANTFLNELRTGTASAASATPLERIPPPADDTDAQDARTGQVHALVSELVTLGCGKPELDIEIADPETGKPLAVAEAYWPDGLQTGQGNPVVLELDPHEAELAKLTELGYEVFTSTDSLLGYVRRRNQDIAGTTQEASDTIQDSPPTPPMDPDKDHREIRADLERAMKDLYERTKSEAGYNATYFLTMLANHGGLETARRLLAAPNPAQGFSALYERDRLDLTVEALVLHPRFAELFTDTELLTARQRLDELGYQ